jgi:TrkA domain protein
MRVEETPLPGVGARYDFQTAAGRQVGLVARRDGTTELVVYAEDDPEYVSESVTLHPDERAALVELLSMPPGQSDPKGRTHRRTWILAEDAD